MRSLSSPAIFNVDARQQPEISDLSFVSEFRTTATTTGADTNATADRDSGVRVIKPPAAGTQTFHEPAREPSHEQR